jgi:hypothetical protein
MRQPGSPDRIALVSTTPMFHIPTCAGLRGTGSTTDVLEAALGALVAYFRVAPLEVSLAAEELEAEEWLVARIPSWTRMQAPNTAPLNEPLGVRRSAAARHRAPSRARAGGHPLGTARCAPIS